MLNIEMINYNRVQSLFKVHLCENMTQTSLKRGSHRLDHICYLGRQNLIASDSSLKVRRQSIPTNCAYSVLRSLPFIK